MPKKKVIIEPAEDTAAWLCTFNDLMTLLLTFFVLLLSMSSLDAQSVKDIQAEMLQALGVLEEGRAKEETIIDKIFNLEEIGKRLKIFKNILPAIEEEIELEQIEKGIPLVERLFEDFLIIKEEGKETSLDEEEYIFNQFKEIIEEDFHIPGITILKKKRGVVLRLADSILFDSGNVNIKDSAYPLLAKVAGVLDRSALHVYIEGHTDSTPIETERFPSNWELSVARSVSVAALLQETLAVSPERIGVSGYGDSLPVSPNTTAANRAKNRRIEIILSKL